MRSLTITAFTFLWLSLPLISMAQVTYDTESHALKKAGSVNVQALKKDFMPQLERVEAAPLPGGKEAKDQLEAIKSELPPKKDGGNSKKQSTKTQEQPFVAQSFEGNQPDGIPNDNDLAISNDGDIVSVTNSMIYMFNEDGTQNKKVSLNKFADTLDIQAGKYDPRVLYDPSEDRFIMVFLNGNTDSTSQVTLAFSKSNDPTQDWNLYSLDGSPVNNQTWSDFPMMAINEEEFYLTLNLIYTDSSWQEGFQQTIIWQVEKQNGYQGQQLTTELYKNITLDNENLRNLRPVQGGSGLTASGMQFLSNNSFALEDNEFFLVSLTGSLDNPPATLTVESIMANNDYGVSPDANQRKQHKFQTNDARVLSAFYENGQIQFAGNTRNLNNNMATIFHGILENPDQNPSIDLTLVDRPNLEYGYPSIAYAGAKGSNEDKSILFFNHSGDSTNAGNSALFYEEGQYLGPFMIKKGDSYVNTYTATSERWGDYTGLQRKYNEAKTFWSAGYYGVYKDFVHANSTWISKIKVDWGASAEQAGKTKPEPKVYPNPADEKLNVDFSIEQGGIYNYKIVNLQGKTVKHLIKTLTKPGVNELSFSLEPLDPGVYFVIAQQGQEVLFKQKFLKN